VKNLLTGMPVTDDDVSKVTMRGAAGANNAGPGRSRRYNIRAGAASPCVTA
jgi:hypothetical protein